MSGFLCLRILKIICSVLLSSGERILPYRMQMECEGFEFTYGIEFLLSQLRDLGQVSSLFLSLSFPKMGIVPI